MFPIPLLSFKRHVWSGMVFNDWAAVSLTQMPNRPAAGFVQPEEKSLDDTLV